MHAAALSFLRAHFELLLGRRSIQDIRLASIAITAAGTHVSAATVHLHFESVATSFGRFRGNITEEIKFVLFAGDALQAAEKIVGIENRESPGALGKGGENLLVGGSGCRKLRNDGAGLIQRIVESAAREASASPTAVPSASGSAFATGPSSAPGSAFATGPSSAPGSACTSGTTAAAARSTGPARSTGAPCSASATTAGAASTSTTTAARPLRKGRENQASAPDLIGLACRLTV
jgi:hypothetical protein